METKQFPLWKKIVGICTGLGIIATGLGGFVNIKTQVDKAVEVEIHKHAEPLIKRNIKTTLDSVMAVKKYSFREALAEKLRIEKKDVVDTLTQWYKSEQNIKIIGLFLKGNRLYYRHTDGEIYQPIYDNSNQKHFFYNKQNVALWCE